MTFLSVENLYKSFGEKILLDDVTFSIEKGQKLAIVAKNGSGKSTLLKIIAQKEEPDKGKVILKTDIRLGFLDQNPEFRDNMTVIDELLNNELEITKAVKLYEESLLDPTDTDKMQNAFELMEKHHAWDFDIKIKDILNNLKLLDINQKINNLSGGQKKRLAIAKLLIENPDLIILDEPTNHLDLEIIDWLEYYLSKNEVTLLMVTHDRYFLDRICDSIIELDNGKIYRHKGNYSYFLEKKAQRERTELLTAEKTAQILKKESIWVNKMPQGRGSKSSLRTENYFKNIQSNFDLKNFINERSKKVKLEIKGNYVGKKVLELHNVSKSFGEKIILDKFNYIFQKNEKLGIIGANGTGKSTFFNLIMEIEKPDSGYITKGETIKFGYYSQNGINVDDNKTIIQTVRDIAEYTYLADGTKITASQMLERFLFSPKIQHKNVSSLSGGEKRRLYLLTVILENPNFLILDEPTNDLDLVTLGILEEFLINYKGCLIIVSHDRYFMDLIIDHIFVFEGDGKIKDFWGNYSQYRESNKDEIEDQDKRIEKKEILSKEEKIELRNLEKEIKRLEDKKAQLSKKFDGITDFEKIRKISDEVKEVVKLIDNKTERWIELSEKV